MMDQVSTVSSSYFRYSNGTSRDLAFNGTYGSGCINDDVNEYDGFDYTYVCRQF